MRLLADWVLRQMPTGTFVDTYPVVPGVYNAHTDRLIEAGWTGLYLAMPAADHRHSLHWHSPRVLVPTYHALRVDPFSTVTLDETNEWPITPFDYLHLGNDDGVDAMLEYLQRDGPRWQLISLPYYREEFLRRIKPILGVMGYTAIAVVEGFACFRLDNR
jgi:hypothetical protein